MKVPCCLLLLWFISNTLLGQPISKEEALSNVQLFLSESNPSLTKSRIGAERLHPVLSYSSPRVYAFDVGEHFILASGDRSMPPILGYSDGCKFDKAFQSDCFKSLLHHISADYNPNFRIYKPTNVAEFIEPLCNDTWHQYAPFNNMTPEIDGKHCVVGCVATSMSELMHYYRHPLVGKGNYSYNDSTGCGQILSSDFSSHVYDWSNMLDDYGYKGSVNYSDASGSAVALLASDCGISVNMSYTSGSSGAQVIRQPIALVNYFDYDKSMQMYYRNFYGQCEWDSIMFNEINEGRPMLIGGWSQTRAHSYICDGYDSNGFFHLRLGNPLEDANGYYYFTWTTPLQPEWYDINTGEGGFNLLQSILVGVKPNTPNSSGIQHYSYVFSHLSPLDQEVLSADNERTFKIGVYSLCNCGWNNHNGIVGIALKNKNDSRSTSIESTNLLYTYSRHFPLEELTDSTFDDTLSLIIPPSVPNGIYKIVPVFEENGSFIEARTMVGTPNYLTIEVSGNQIFLFEPKDERSSLRIISANFPDEIYRMDYPEFNYTLTNDGAEYSGRIFCFLYQDHNPKTEYLFGRQGVSIDTDEIQTYEFKHTRVNTIPAGNNFHLRIYADIDLFTDSLVLLFDDSIHDITVYNGNAPSTSISSITPPSSSSLYYDLTGRKIDFPLSLPKHSIYIEIDKNGNTFKRIKK